MHFKVSPKSVFVLSNMLKRARVSYESAKSALVLPKVLTQQKRGWSLVQVTLGLGTRGSRLSNLILD